MRRLGFSGFLSFATLLASLASCAPEGDRFGRFRERDEQVFYFNNFEEPEYIDPALLTGHPDSFVASQLFEGLTSPNPKTLKPEPALATRWEVLNEGRSYRFFLRKDAKWSDQKAITAHDFVYSIERALRPSTAARYSYQLHPIKYGKAYNEERVARVSSNNARPSREPFVVTSRSDSLRTSFAPYAFEQGARVRLIDSNLRRAKRDNTPLRKSPDSKSEIVSRLSPQRAALVLAAKYKPGSDEVLWWQVRPPLGDAAGWVSATEVEAEMPSLTHRVIDTEAESAAARVAPKRSAALRMSLDDESEVELIEEGETFSLVRDFLSGKSGYVNNNELDDWTGDRHWLFVEATEKKEGFAEKGWVSARLLRSDAQVLGVEAEDEHTLRIDLEEATPYFLSLTYFSAMLPVPRQAIEAHGPRWTRPKNIVTSGAFTLKSHKARDRMILEPSKSYYDAKVVKLKRVEIFAVSDVHTNVNLFRSGHLDGMHSAKLPLELVPGFKGKKDYVSAPYLASYFVRMNTQKEPLGDVRVRRALNLAIDKNALTQKLLKGGQTTASHIVPPGLPGYPLVEGDSYNVEKARALMAEAGFKDGVGFPKLNYLFNTADEHQHVAEFLQRSWKDALGIDIVLQNQEWKTFLQKMHAMDYDLSRSGWIGDYLDPNTFLEMWVTGGGNNETGYANPEYDALIDAARREQDFETRMQHFAKAEAMLNRDVPFAPLYYYVNNFLLAPEVKGFHANLTDHHTLKHVYIDAGQK